MLAGRCIQLVGSGLPYLPFVDALRPLRDSAQLGELAPMLRELPRLVPDLAGGDVVAPSGAARAESRLGLFEEVLAVLGHLSSSAPVLLVLEDLQWADDSTLDLVAFLGHAIAQRRILLVATYRSDERRAPATTSTASRRRSRPQAPRRR